MACVSVYLRGTADRDKSDVTHMGLRSHVLKGRWKGNLTRATRGHKLFGHGVQPQILQVLGQIGVCIICKWHAVKQLHSNTNIMIYQPPLQGTGSIRC